MRTPSQKMSAFVMIKNYAANNCFDEMLDAKGRLRPHYKKFQKLFQGLTRKEFEASGRRWTWRFCGSVTLQRLWRQRRARSGFSVRHDSAHQFPRGWEHIERGLAQRITALNLFLHDIYHEQKNFEMDASSRHFTSCLENISGAEFVNFEVPREFTFSLRNGFDPRPRRQLSRAGNNGRCPSGVSYVFGKPRAMKRAFRRCSKHRRPAR